VKGRLGRSTFECGIAADKLNKYPHRLIIRDFFPRNLKDQTLADLAKFAALFSGLLLEQVIHLSWTHHVSEQDDT